MRFVRCVRFVREVQGVIYTTNPLENVNRQLRKILKTRGHFPTEEAATKLIWLGIGRLETGSVGAVH